MSRATDAMTGFICAMLDEGALAGDGAYHRDQFPERLETTARALVELLAAVYPAIDDLHERVGHTVPPKYRGPVEWAEVTIKP